MSGLGGPVFKLDRSLVKKIIISFCGILINVGAMAFVYATGFPLYLNTIGTILVAKECGLFSSLLVALLSNVLTGTFYPQSIYYAIVNILIAQISNLFFYKHLTEKRGGKLLLVSILAVSSGLLGGIIDFTLLGWTVNPALTELEGFFNISESTGLSIVYFSVCIVFSFFDKLASVLIVYLILWISAKIKSLSTFDVLKDKFTDVVKKEDEWDRDTRNRFRRKMVYVIALEATALTCVISWISLSIYENTIKNNRIQVALGAAQHVADVVMPGEVDGYLKEGGYVKDASYTYGLTNYVIRSIQKNTPSLAYLYVYRMEEDGIEVIFDTDPYFVEYGTIGQKIEYEEAFVKYIPDFLAGKEIDVVESNDKYGWLITAYVPIYSKDKTRCIGYAGADVSMSDVSEYSRSFILRVLLISISFLIVMLALGLGLSNKYHSMMDYQYERFKEAKEDADRANLAKTRFLANMSHEIRTPINTIVGMDELILREDTSNVPTRYLNDINEYATDIRLASDVLLQLVNDILDLSRIESGKMEIVYENYYIMEEIRAIVRMIRIRAKAKGLGFSTLIDPKLPKILHGDKGKIKQVLINLLTNAVKYTQEGGFTLSVQCLEKKPEKCRILFSVRDTGSGIKKDDIEKLFDAFERLDFDKNSSIQGTGLGLNISKQFVALMGGELKCESTIGEGSNFYFSIEQEVLDETPIGEFVEKTEEDNNYKYEPLFRASTGKILVVDDNEMNLQVVNGLLRSTKLQVTTCTSGKECLKKLDEGEYDLVLLDHMMPEMDGIETIKRIREKEIKTRVIALTANVTTGGVEYYRSVGFDDYLSKPVTGRKLEEMIFKHLPIQVFDRNDAPNADNLSASVDDDKKDDEALINNLRNMQGISVDDGLEYTGSPKALCKFINTFRDSIERKTAELKEFYDRKDIENFTIKVHALKSTARMIGAKELSEMALRLEMAGKEENVEYIDEHVNELFEEYAKYKEYLKL